MSRAPGAPALGAYASPLAPAAVAALMACGGGATAPASIDPSLDCEVSKRDGCYKRVPAGTWTVGAQSVDPAAPGYDPDARPEEGPVRTVTLPAFWMMEEEARASAWSRCVQTGACADAAGPGPGLGAARDFVGGVTWHEATQLCAFLGGRLPTGDEWEVAARGDDGRRFPWGTAPPCGLGTADDPFNALPRAAWTTIPGCTPGHEWPRARSPFGLRDMAWAHWEWVADEGPGGTRAQRGGSWVEPDPADHRAVARTFMPPTARVADAGVRCAWSP